MLSQRPRLALVFLALFALQTTAGTFETPNPVQTQPLRHRPEVGRIAFFSDRSGNFRLYVVSEDRSWLILVTKPDALPGWEEGFAMRQWPVAWSPRGRMLAFASMIPYDGWGVFVAKADGSGVRRLTKVPHNEGTVSNVSWSPDGTRIAFEQTFSIPPLPSGGNAQTDIMVAKADGSNLENLTNTESASEITAEWSPDGTGIVFDKIFLLEDKREIWTMNSDGSSQTRLSQNPGTVSIPRWSPDGSRISFWGEGCYGIYVTNIDGSDQTCVLEETTAYHSWSPDSTRIAVDKDGEIYITDTDGTDVFRITPDTGFGKTYPSWSGGGDKIAFQGAQNIYVINIDGSNMIQLTRNEAEDTRPTWAPTRRACRAPCR